MKWANCHMDQSIGYNTEAQFLIIFETKKVLFIFDCHQKAFIAN